MLDKIAQADGLDKDIQEAENRALFHRALFSALSSSVSTLLLLLISCLIPLLLFIYMLMTHNSIFLFSSTDFQSRLSAFSSALDSLYNWFSSNRLYINPSKTEFRLIGTPQQRLKFSSISIAFRSPILSPTTHCRNLGVVFDSDLSFDKHISSICSSSFYHIRQLRQIRSVLDRPSAILLANALVSTKLDYCNSLLFGLPLHSIRRLQLV